MSVSHLAPDLKVVTADGAAAGDVTVTGIRLVDHLIAVINLTDGTTVTGEFTISADDTINNDGGTTSDTDTLLVIWFAADSRGGGLNRS